ncbi:MAG TPA: phosphoglycerate dehydrogenase [Bacillota bacterium]|jgi:D-3-phosphoglycerate dehydrogenase|nr:phosphoglycerate dehydrogenase [Bacillota bacterium]
MEYRVLVTPAFFGRKNLTPIHLLSEAGCEVVPNPHGRTATEDEMCALVADVDAAIVSLDRVTEKVLASGPRLRVVARCGVGYDNIDVAAATRMGIFVTNVPGANSRAVAEMTVGLMFDVARRISMMDRRMREGIWKGHVGFELGGKTLGIIGTGSIGKLVAELGVGLRMRVLCYSRTHDRIWADAIGAAYVSLDELLRTSDVVSLHIALTDDTRNLISERELSLMKPSAILINTSRGAALDEDALYVALREGRLSGAGLDVFVEEPLDQSRLLVLENVVLTPHISGLTVESAHAMAMGAARNVVAVLHGRTPENAVNAPRASG